METECSAPLTRTFWDQYPASLVVLQVMTMTIPLWTPILAFYSIRSTLRILFVCFFPHWKNIFISLILWRCNNYRASVLRQEFREMRFPHYKPNPRHSHGLCAANRTAADDALNTLVVGAGFVPYSVGMSTRDVRNKVEGQRIFFGAKDLAMNAYITPVRPHHVFKFLDTDYYCDMSAYARSGNHMMIYTAVPTMAGGDIQDGFFKIENNVIHTYIDGGAHYEHQVWDYSTDHVIFHYWWGSQVYLVESTVTDDPERRLVGLFHVRTVWGPWAWCLPGFQLERRKFEHGGMNYVRTYHRTKGLIVSISKPGSEISVTLREIVYRAILTRIASAPKPLLSDIEKITRTEKVPDPSNVAALLYSWWPMLKQAAGKIQMDGGRFSDEDGAIHYQPLGTNIFEDGKPMGRIIGPQLCTGNVMPVRSQNSDESCIKHRVLDKVNRVRCWPSKYKAYSSEFAQLLVPDHLIGTGVPWATEEVVARQSRATQMRQFLAATNFFWMFRMIVSSFQKAETYPKYAAPRNISTVNADHRHRYSGYIYPITEYLLKPQRWYAFAKSPDAIARSVHDLASSSEWLIPTDYTAWDGTHSEPLCKFEKMIGRRFLAPTYHEEWDELVMQQYQATGFTTHGIRYNTGFSRLSGSADTSAFNSLDNALIAYFVLREQGNDRETAWNKLGLYGGDDGLTPDVDPECYVRTTKELGHELKATVVSNGDTVPFLGRLYLDAWVSPNSVIDIQRQARRLHLTNSPATVPDIVCLQRKAEGLLVTDNNTPLISHWANAVLRVTKPREMTEEDWASSDVGWFAQQQEDQFPQYEWDHPRVWEVAADELETTIQHLKETCDSLNNARRLSDFPTMAFVLTPPQVKIAVETNGKILEPEAEPDRLEAAPVADSSEVPQQTQSHEYVRGHGGTTECRRPAERSCASNVRQQTRTTDVHPGGQPGAMVSRERRQFGGDRSRYRQPASSPTLESRARQDPGPRGHGQVHPVAIVPSLSSGSRTATSVSGSRKRGRRRSRRGSVRTNSSDHQRDNQPGLVA
jgi:hypothetical protein